MARVTALGNLIRQRRLSLGLTQEQLEELTGISQHYISQIERGKVSKPGERFVTALASGLDLSEDDLLVAMGSLEIRKVVVSQEGSIVIRVRGVIPAETIRYSSGEGAAMEEVRVLPEDVAGARAPISELFGRQVLDDCFKRIGIWPGDVVILEPMVQRTPADRAIVLVRVKGEYSLKRWRAVGGQVELLDGGDVVVYRLSERDDFEVLGSMVTWKPIAPRQ